MRHELHVTGGNASATRMTATTGGAVNLHGLFRPCCSQPKKQFETIAGIYTTKHALRIYPAATVPRFEL
jgi:hypothetical protein